MKIHGYLMIFLRSAPALAAVLFCLSCSDGRAVDSDAGSNDDAAPDSSSYADAAPDADTDTDTDTDTDSDTDGDTDTDADASIVCDASTWLATIEGPRVDSFHSLIECSDNGIVVAGETGSFGAPERDAWVVKLDLDGKIIWQKTIGGQEYDASSSIVETRDQDIVVAGTTLSFGAGDEDIWIIRMDSNGGIVWQKTIGGSGDDSAASVTGTQDNGIAIAGTTASFGAGGSDIWIVKMDRDGEIEWQQTFGQDIMDYAASIMETSDNDLVISGYGYPESGWSRHLRLIKLSPDGNLIWQKTTGGNKQIEIHSIIQTMDGNLAMGGSCIDYTTYLCPMILMKTDQNGELIWSVFADSADIEDGSESEQINSLAETSDRHLTAGAHFYAIGWDWEAYGSSLMLFDDTGGLEWAQRFSNLFSESSVIWTSDSRILGTSSSIVFKTDAQGDISGECLFIEDLPEITACSHAVEIVDSDLDTGDTAVQAVTSEGRIKSSYAISQILCPE